MKVLTAIALVLVGIFVFFVGQEHGYVLRQVDAQRQIDQAKINAESWYVVHTKSNDALHTVTYQKEVQRLAEAYNGLYKQLQSQCVSALKVQDEALRKTEVTLGMERWVNKQRRFNGRK